MRAFSAPLCAALVLLAAACGPDGRGDDDIIGDDDMMMPCSAGQTRCDGNVYETCVNGVFTPEETCTLPAVCVIGTGCQACNPNVATFCDGDAVYQCNADGTKGNLVEQCAFESCAGGACTDPCSAAAQNRSYIGCEYWPVDLDNAVEVLGTELIPGFGCSLFDPSAQLVSMPVCWDGAAPSGACDFNNDCSASPGTTCQTQSVCVLNAQGSPFAIVVSNPDPAQAAMVTLTNSGGTTKTFTVGAGTVQSIFPQMNGFADQSLDHSGIEAKAYKLTSDRPIVAYQFNPLDNVGVFSNDGSLLIPATAFDTRYIALGYPTLGRRPTAHDYHGYVTVVASAPGMTMVTVKASAAVRAGNGVAALAMGATQVYMLQQFQTLNLEAAGPSGDLSGSEIDCAPACGVYVGTEASGIGKDPGGNCCADHLEDMLFPASTWGKAYAIARTKQRSNEPDLIRIIAQKPNTTVSFNPAPAMGTCGTLNVGQFCEVRISTDTEISSPEPILVAHYLMSIGTGAGNPSGDPAISYAVPTEQFRKSYAFLVPSQYAENYVSLVAPAGGTVMLDGTAVTGMTPIGSGAFVGTRTAVQPGPHKLDCPQGCGVEVYGYDGAVSYLFAGGLDLEQIVVE